MYGAGGIYLRKFGGCNCRSFMAVALLVAMSSTSFRVNASGTTNAGAEPVFDFAQRPIQFIPNEGQFDPRVRFYEQGPSHATYFAQTGVYQAIGFLGAEKHGRQRSQVRLSFQGMNPDAKLQSATKLAARVNYYTGRGHPKHKAKLTGLPTYGSVWYRSVYPGVDVRFHGDQGALEYDIHIAPGSSPERVVMQYDGARAVSITSDGQLAVDLDGGRILQAAPFAYQVVAGKRVQIPARYHLESANDQHPPTYGFALAKYDRSRPLIIDPVIVSSGYLGGSEDDTANAIATDAAGNLYVTGSTWSMDFPTLMALKATAQAEYRDVFVSKFDASGALIYSTYLGGGNMEAGNSIAVDSAANAYVTGVTLSQNFPVTAQAFQSAGDGVFEDAFVVKIDPLGGLLYSSYLGGTLDDEGNSVVVDESGANVTVVVAGETWSHDFPAVSSLYTVLDTGNNRDAFVVRMDLGQSGAASMLWSTYLGGGNRDSGAGVDVDGTGNVYIVGTTESADFPVVANGYHDPFVLGFSRVFLARLSASGGVLQYVACLGGGGDDIGRGVAVDATGNAYITGSTHSTNFPTVNPLYTVLDTGDNNDAFATKIDTNATGLGSIIYSTYLGGSGHDEGRDIAIDAMGDVYVAGYTRSVNFPVIGTTTAPMNALQGDEDGFVVKLGATGSSVIYSIYLGGTDEDYINGIDVMGPSDVVLVGQTRSTDFPLLNPYQSTLLNNNRSAFLVRLQ